MDISTTKQSSIFPVLLVNFIGMLGYSIIIPLLVFLVQDFGGNAFIYGLLGAIYPSMQLIGAPILGKWSDQIGRKRVLMVSQIGTFMAWLLFIVALLLPIYPLFKVESSGTESLVVSLPLLLLFLARAIDGLTGGNVSVANAYLADVSTEQNRKANFGKMASSTSLGFILGPALAAVLGATFLGELLPVAMAAVISLTAIFVILFFLPESKPELLERPLDVMSIKKVFQIEQKECYQVEQCPANRLSDMLKIEGIPLLYLMYFVTFLGFSFFYAGLPLFASGVLEWTSLELGTFFMVSSGIMVLIQGPGLTYLSDKVSDINLVIIGAVLILANFVLLPIATLEAVYLGNVLLSIGNGIMWPSFLSILSRPGASNQKGTIQGYANSMGSAASIFGLILGGQLFGQIGPSVFYFAAGMFVFVLALALLLKSRLKDNFAKI
ncbi:MAG: MFS transporter [Bacteroidota bacterium]